MLSVTSQPPVFLLDCSSSWHMDVSSLIQPPATHRCKLRAEKANEASGKPRQSRKHGPLPGPASDPWEGRCRPPEPLLGPPACNLTAHGSFRSQLTRALPQVCFLAPSTTGKQAFQEMQRGLLSWTAGPPPTLLELAAPRTPTHTCLVGLDASRVRISFRLPPTGCWQPPWGRAPCGPLSAPLTQSWPRVRAARRPPGWLAGGRAGTAGHTPHAQGLRLLCPGWRLWLPSRTDPELGPTCASMCL